MEARDGLWLPGRVPEGNIRGGDAEVFREGILPPGVAKLLGAGRRSRVTTCSGEHRFLPIEHPLCKSGQSLTLKLNQLQGVRSEPSVGSAGDSYDNALAETVIGLYKTEVIHRRGPWRSLDDVEFATLEWVDWFNNRRLLEPIGYVPPVAFEEAYYSRQEAPAMVAGVT